MIVDLDHYIAKAQPFWEELESLLEAHAGNTKPQAMSMEEAEHFHELYLRASSDLVRVRANAVSAELETYLENLVGRAYSEIYQERRRVQFSPWHWFWQAVPNCFRRHLRAFRLSCLLTLLGVLFGGMVLLLYPEAKEDFLGGFGHLHGSPSERVAKEEQQDEGTRSREAVFAAYLMTHNTKVTIFAACLGITLGLGTGIMLFSNGVILGLVCLDYLLAGEGLFLAGWLLPHGVIEIPCILLGGQAGLVLAGAFWGQGDFRSLPERLKAILPDFATLVASAGLFLVWAGLVEAFFSQHHKLVLPYAVKITFGLVEFSLFLSYWVLAGRKKERLNL